MELRKISIFVEDILSEGGRKLMSPTRRVAACGVIRNPFQMQLLFEWGLSGPVGTLAYRRTH